MIHLPLQLPLPSASVTARAGGVVNVNDLDGGKDSAVSPECKDSGNRMSSLECSPEFSVADDMDSVLPAMLPTDNEV
jgi:hypothetical protein